MIWGLVFLPFSGPRVTADRRAGTAVTQVCGCPGSRRRSRRLERRAELGKAWTLERLWREGKGLETGTTSEWQQTGQSTDWSRQMETSCQGRPWSVETQ